MMVIANACGHPDCQNARAAEIIRLMGENEALRVELAKGGKS